MTQKDDTITMHIPHTTKTKTVQDKKDILYYTIMTRQDTRHTTKTKTKTSQEIEIDNTKARQRNTNTKKKHT